MSQDSKEKAAFHLIVDEERCRVLIAMLGGIHSEDKLFRELTRFYVKEGLAESFESFLDEFNYKMHEYDWCQDPECTYEKD